MMPIENTWPCIVSLFLANKKSWSKIWLKFKLDFTPLKSFYTEHPLLLGSNVFLFKVKTVDVVTKVEGWWWLWKCARGHPFGAKISKHIHLFSCQMAATLCLLSFKYFSQHVQFWKLGNIPRYSPVLAGEYLVAWCV